MMLQKKSHSSYVFQPLEEEYSVYVFFRQGQKDAKGQDLSYQWEKARKTRHKVLALKKAERLFRSNQYQKVVVKYRYLDCKSGRSQGQTFKTFGEGRPFLLWLRRSFLSLKVRGDRFVRFFLFHDA